MNARIRDIAIVVGVLAFCILFALAGMRLGLWGLK